jgi:hypothetical protein
MRIEQKGTNLMLEEEGYPETSDKKRCCRLQTDPAEHERVDEERLRNRKTGCEVLLISSKDFLRIQTIPTHYSTVSSTLVSSPIYPLSTSQSVPSPSERTLPDSTVVQVRPSVRTIQNLKPSNRISISLCCEK